MNALSTFNSETDEMSMLIKVDNSIRYLVEESNLLEQQLFKLLESQNHRRSLEQKQDTLPHDYIKIMTKLKDENMKLRTDIKEVKRHYKSKIERIMLRQEDALLKKEEEIRKILRDAKYVFKMHQTISDSSIGGDKDLIDDLQGKLNDLDKETDFFKKKDQDKGKNKDKSKSNILNL